MNTKQRRILFGIILLAGLFWIVPGIPKMYAQQDSSAKEAPQEGFLAPEFTLETIEGDSVSLHDFRGKVIVLNFWATWCPPCREEMPALQSMYEKYREEGMVVLAVDLTAQDTTEDVQAFIAKNSLTFPVLMDVSATVARAYRAQALPTTFFIGKDGTIQKIIVGGPMSPALLETRIETLLEEMP